jgi:hypothetical protein
MTVVPLLVQQIFVHFDDVYGYHLFGLHLRGVLPGFPIPRHYKVYESEEVSQYRSFNLTLSKEGSHVDTEELAEHIGRLKIFGSVVTGRVKMVAISTPIAA